MKSRVALALLLFAVSLPAWASPTAAFTCPSDDDGHGTDRCNFTIYSADGQSHGGAVVNEGRTQRFAVSGPDDEWCMARVGPPDDDTCVRQPVEGYED